MSAEDALETDGTPIKPVSSLRSHFEHITAPLPASDGSRTLKTSVVHNRAASGDSTIRPFNAQQLLEAAQKRPSRTNPAVTPKEGSQTLRTGKPASSPPSTRRQAVLPRPEAASIPIVGITSPSSTPTNDDKLVPRKPHDSSTSDLIPRSLSPQASPLQLFRIPSRSPSPQNRDLLGRESLDIPKAHRGLVNNVGSSPARLANRDGHGKGPPPVNRGAKPRMDAKDILSAAAGPSSRASGPPTPVGSRKTSPFSTPPDSNTSTSAQEAIPPVPHHSKPIASTSAKDLRNSPRNVSLPSASAEMDHIMEIRTPLPVRASTNSSHQSTLPVLPNGGRPPSLPPRKTLPTVESKPLPLPPRPSFENSSGPSALSQGFATSLPLSQSSSRVASFASAASTHDVRHIPSHVRAPTGTRTPPRAVPDLKLALPSTSSVTTTSSGDMDTVPVTEYPDSSQANRRPPHYSAGPKLISNGYETRVFDACGEFACATGLVTRVWSLLTGKLILSLPHGEGIRGTAISFKPTRTVEDQGKHLWIGTNMGDILEVDVATKKIAQVNDTAHHRHEICGMFQYATNLWTLDSEGKLFVWPTGAGGAPSLENGVLNFRTGRRPTASVVVGNQLWLAFAKDLRILQPSGLVEDSSVDVAHSAPSFTDLGDITAAATLSTQQQQVYFGHGDGKISVYSTTDYTCQDVLYIGNNKITSLVGAGSYLWAGYAAGMLFVYDTTQRPWVVKKEWRPHTSSVVSLLTDHSSIWKLNRLQVLSLGADNAIGVWDGMLEEDWLENDMLARASQFCSFRKSSALVVSWNAGACKPIDLTQDSFNYDFFSQLLEVGETPDILVFGFQELVDLENKRVTAKSIFKSKKSDEYGREHLSRVYRQWRDYLVERVNTYLSTTDPYIMLHTASLVGLFTCVFVKASEQANIRGVQAAEVKTGLGGLHGNKGALLVRFTIDDSSLCFVNCHLAAGQAHILQRNNDVATILESSHLPGQQLPASQTEVYVGGGDGSMVLDHELCFMQGDLNYRIDTMSRDSVVDAITAGDLDKLIDHDQLTLQRRKLSGFRLRAFQEAPISFEPTYKYDVGTDNYDSSEKKRVPAWCDRILYRGAGNIIQEDYRRHEVRVSDHRPVSGRFSLRIKTIQAGNRLGCWKESEKRFEKVKQEVSTRAKLDYLQSTYGLSAQEARKMLEA